MSSRVVSLALEKYYNRWWYTNATFDSSITRFDDHCRVLCDAVGVHPADGACGQARKQPHDRLVHPLNPESLYVDEPAWYPVPLESYDSNDWELPHPDHDRTTALVVGVYHE